MSHCIWVTPHSGYTWEQLAVCCNVQGLLKLCVLGLFVPYSLVSFVFHYRAALVLFFTVFFVQYCLKILIFLYKNKDFQYLKIFKYWFKDFPKNFCLSWRISVKIFRLLGFCFRLQACDISCAQENWVSSPSDNLKLLYYFFEVYLTSRWSTVPDTVQSIFE